LNPFFDGTIGTAVEDAVGFYPMTYNGATTMMTGRSQGSNGTFKAIEDMGLSTHDDLKGLVVVIATPFTLRHSRSTFLFCWQLKAS
jgi:hypothetical protein